jgi:hypothetical protein
MNKTRMGSAILALALGACAPDAWRPDPGYEAFLNTIQKECAYFQIGTSGYEQLFGDSRFLDITSRLYYGKVTRQGWQESMEAMYSANPNDRGMACLLAKLPATPQSAPGMPVGLTPVPSSGSPAPTPGGPKLPPPPGTY